MNHQASTAHTLTFTKLIIAGDHSKHETRVCFYVPPRVVQVGSCFQQSIHLFTTPFNSLFENLNNSYRFCIYNISNHSDSLRFFIHAKTLETKEWRDERYCQRLARHWREIENELSRLAGRRSCLSLRRTASAGCPQMIFL